MSPPPFGNRCSAEDPVQTVVVSLTPSCCYVVAESWQSTSVGGFGVVGSERKEGRKEGKSVGLVSLSISDLRLIACEWRLAGALPLLASWAHWPAGWATHLEYFPSARLPGLSWQ